MQEKRIEVSQKCIFGKNFHRVPIQNTLVTENSLLQDIIIPYM